VRQRRIHIPATSNDSGLSKPSVLKVRALWILHFVQNDKLIKIKLTQKEASSASFKNSKKGDQSLSPFFISQTVKNG